MKKRRDPTPLDEPAASVILHVWLPSTVALLLLLASVALDLLSPEAQWTQRSGAILIVAGAYIAFHETRWHERYVETNGGVKAYYNPEIWYKWLALFLVLIGTVLTGYGEIIL